MHFPWVNLYNGWTCTPVGSASPLSPSTITQDVEIMSIRAESENALPPRIESVCICRFCNKGDVACRRGQAQDFPAPVIRSKDPGIGRGAIRHTGRDTERRAHGHAAYPRHSNPPGLCPGRDGVKGFLFPHSVIQRLTHTAPSIGKAVESLNIQKPQARQDGNL